MSNIKNWLKENYRLIILIFLAVLFFSAYSYLPYNTPLKFNSPDETANYFWSKLYSQDSQLRFYEPLNSIANNIIHPRSFNVLNGNLVPGSFLGLILIYGFLAKFIGANLIIYLTPFFSVLAVLFFYKTIEKIFSKNIAFFSSLLLFIFPGWWYYSSRSMMPNVLFASLLIIGFCFLLKITSENKKVRIISSFLAGIFIGLSLLVRSSEFIWVGLIIFVLFLFYFKKINWPEALIFIIALSLVSLPLFYFNQKIYGNFLKTGYSQFNSPQDGAIAAASWLNCLFPFGIDFKNIAKNFYDYYIWIFWWFFIPIILGGLLFVIKIFRRPKKQIAYFIICILISAFLIIYYGSWKVQDSPDLGRATIGTSYARYWLPVYILSLPYAGLFFSKLLKRKKIGGIVLALMLLVMVFFSVKLTVFDNQEGVLKVKENIFHYQDISRQVFDMTEENAVIVANRSDKIFFPERRVIFKLISQDDLQGLSNILDENVPVYVFNITYPEKDINYLNNKKFAEFGFKISEPIKTFGELSLYKLQKF